MSRLLRQSLWGFSVVILGQVAFAGAEAKLGLRGWFLVPSKPVSVSCAACSEPPDRSLRVI